MLPSFPRFKKINLEDKVLVDEIANSLPPYSDFNFVSLLSWDTEGTVEISRLNKNIVVKFADYLTLESFLSFVGTNNVDATIHTLIKYGEQHGFESVLKLIPHSVVKHIKDKAEFVVKEDRDNFDYVIDLADFITLTGSKKRTRRHEINRFNALHGKNTHIKLLDLGDEKLHAEIIQIFYKWEKSKAKSRTETQNELNALKKLLENAEHFDLHVIGFYINKKLEGFSIYEVLHNKYSIGHFEKADTKYEGIFQFMKHHAALSLMKREVVYFNEEQDFGLEALRRSKLSHRPNHYLKKYIISLKE